ncbi:MAG: hypothetical protein JXD23_07455 [Spirochaetales bacterium]|nr:hypothetical protein [Spirochaetales bacterium]
MKKILLIAALLSVIAIGSASAQAVQFRMDANLSVPVYWGYFSTTFGGTYGEVMQFAFVIPEFDAYVQLNMGMFRMGLGFRLFTIILESAAVPDIYFELNIDPIVIRLGCSGGAFMLFGLVSAGPEFGPVIAPDLYVGFKFVEFFRAGIGCTVIMDLNYPDTGVFVPYVNAKLVIALPEQQKAESE